MLSAMYGGGETAHLLAFHHFFHNSAGLILFLSKVRGRGQRRQDCSNSGEFHLDGGSTNRYDQKDARKIHDMRIHQPFYVSPQRTSCDIQGSVIDSDLFVAIIVQ